MDLKNNIDRTGVLNTALRKGQERLLKALYLNPACSLHYTQFNKIHRQAVDSERSVSLGMKGPQSPWPPLELLLFQHTRSWA
ncbi:hypothetical protein EYF80_012080 [Liparis tanakae]|uniref:Uncharacterized protein n=1 Tax=Liparis tanakae TaxID=230148 RepID=A0A4Z2IKM5_9TELE|nr:hypothetical protein EYF80_012080 [Liparis tanakae]